MTRPPLIVFVFNLVQDVAVLRPLIYLALRETEAKPVFLITDGFFHNDGSQRWQAELRQIALDTGAQVYRFGAISEALAVLQGGHGLVLAGSESALAYHWQTHELFRALPPAYLRITLQHGFECIGFRHSAEHDRAYGTHVRSHADVLCGWMEAPALTALTPGDRDRLYVAGPPSLLNRRSLRPRPAGAAPSQGMICENLHSVRLGQKGELRSAFLETFSAFCADLAARGAGVTLRPHPAGQYMLRSGPSLGPEVSVSTAPLYHVDLDDVAYGISAPSTVVFDLVLAGVPVAVWEDDAGRMDTRNYDGLARVRSLADWLDFERDATLQRAGLLARQAAFLDALAMPTDPGEVYRRYVRLLAGALTRSAPALPAVSSETRTAPADLPPVRRVLALVAQADHTGVRDLVGALGDHPGVQVDVLTIETLSDRYGALNAGVDALFWLRTQMDAGAPDLIFCHALAGPHATLAANHAARRGVPLIVHLDSLRDWPTDMAGLRLMRAADLVHVPDESGRQDLRARNLFGPVTVLDLSAGPQAQDSVLHLFAEALQIRDSRRAPRVPDSPMGGLVRPVAAATLGVNRHR